MATDIRCLFGFVDTTNFGIMLMSLCQSAVDQAWNEFQARLGPTAGQ